MTTNRAPGLALGFSIVGPGRVGSSLARWLVASGAKLTAVGARSPEPGDALATELGGTSVPSTELSSSADDLLLVTVADAAVANVAEQLGQRPQAAVALHASGAVGIEAMAPLRAACTSIGGLHPLRAFPSASRDLTDASSTVFTIGGDPSATTMARRLVECWGGIPIPIEDHQRPLYHLAASLAAGGVVTLLATATELAQRAGLPAAVVGGYHRLATQAVRESEQRPTPASAITGPIARGDLETLSEQLESLYTEDPEAIEIVVGLAHETLRQRTRIDSSPKNRDGILSILAKVMERKSFLDRQ